MWGERKTVLSLICYNCSTCLLLTKAALSLGCSVCNSQRFRRKGLEMLHSVRKMSFKNKNTFINNQESKYSNYLYYPSSIAEQNPFFFQMTLEPQKTLHHTKTIQKMQLLEHWIRSSADTSEWKLLPFTIIFVSFIAVPTPFVAQSLAQPSPPL